MNSTVSTFHHHHHPIDEPTAINEIEPKHYDSAGAALFIVVVILWYSIGIVCMLGMQIRARSETIEECTRRRAKLFIQTLRDQTQTKEILEELADKQKRDKLWDIYLGKTDNNKEKLERAEHHRIRNIQKQLNVINRTRLIMNETFVSPVMHTCIRRTASTSQSTSIPDLSTVKTQPRTRRRSSVDQQIIEQWKAIVDHSKAHGQLPWTIRKKLIRRHFRRCFKSSSNELEHDNISQMDSSSNQDHLESVVDDEQCHLLPVHQEVNDCSRRLSKETDNRLNPYVTYFHLPVNENFELNIQNLPLTTIRSDHQIVQMYPEESQC